MTEQIKSNKRSKMIAPDHGMWLGMDKKLIILPSDGEYDE